MESAKRDLWAVILGGSSGIGLASARRLAKDGFNLCIVHFDRRAQLHQVEQDFEALRSIAPRLITFNVNAVEVEGRSQVIEALREIPKARVRLLLHSIAYGNLKPLRELQEDDFLLTIRAMGTSLFTWTRALLDAGLFDSYAQVLGLTSEGADLAIPDYAAVASAKMTLRALMSAQAAEFAQFGIRTNLLQPGAIVTPALARIPKSKEILESSLRRNPFGRLTAPEDIARVVSLFCQEDAAWINGCVIPVDGGEHVSVGL